MNISYTNIFYIIELKQKKNIRKYNTQCTFVAVLPIQHAVQL